jgi:hypothetical protein
MVHDERRKIIVSPAPVVDHREDVCIYRERTRGYIAGLHLPEFRQSGHKGIALFVGRARVVESFQVHRLSRAL